MTSKGCLLLFIAVAGLPTSLLLIVIAVLQLLNEFGRFSSAGKVEGIYVLLGFASGSGGIVLFIVAAICAKLFFDTEE